MLKFWLICYWLPQTFNSDVAFMKMFIIYNADFATICDNLFLDEAIFSGWQFCSGSGKCSCIFLIFRLNSTTVKISNKNIP